MSFIDKDSQTVLNIKLTSKGRELLSKGNLSFKYFAIGDSEIDYEYISNVSSDQYSSGFTGFNSSVLQALDKNPDIISYIPRTLSGDLYNEIINVPSSNYIVENNVESIGFFNSDNSEYLIDSNHIKQPDCMIKVNEVEGGYTLTIYKSPNYGISSEEPTIGDMLYVKWTTVDSTVNNLVNPDKPTMNLFYKIIGIVGSSKLSDGSISVNVDRELPNFSGMGLSDSILSGAMILYNTLNYTDASVLSTSSTDYVDESVIAFLENSQCPTIVFPFWNLSIIYTDEIVGVSGNNMKFSQFKTKSLGGFVSYIQNQSKVFNKLGVIHYTNNSPANVYGEGFLLNTSKIDIPTIMWHKSVTPRMGVTLSANGNVKMLTGTTKSLNIMYYDLSDDSGYVVGKVFPDLKIFVIEDQELLFALSYKSNRSWTLPNYSIGI